MIPFGFQGVSHSYADHRVLHGELLEFTRLEELLLFLIEDRVIHPIELQVWVDRINSQHIKRIWFRSLVLEHLTILLLEDLFDYILLCRLEGHSYLLLPLQCFGTDG